jgi:sulfur-oxidizing protein SoxY
MNQTRRNVLRISSALGAAFAAGILTPQEVFAGEWSAQVFDAKSLEAAVKALGGDKFEISTELTLIGPDIAENGAVVPISVSSKAAGTDFIAILVEKNPSAMSASFNIPAGTEPSVTTRVKMGGTSNVHALAKANGKWLVATKEIKVTLGGCGG